MKIASFNINGMKARLSGLIEWLKEKKPDIVGLQEIKTDDPELYRSYFENLGYRTVFKGQKAYNGCAILSRYELNNVMYGLPGKEQDNQSRFLCVDTNKLKICNIYLPNGNPIESEKFTYKLEWMEALKNFAKGLVKLGKPALIMGDFNVIPQIEDCKDPTRWNNDALFHPKVRSKFFEIINLGFDDAIRLKTQDSEIFTQWEYTNQAWERNDGVRIDHLLLNPEAADLLIRCGVDSYMRAKERPSDHIPVWVELA